MSRWFLFLTISFLIFKGGSREFFKFFVSQNIIDDDAKGLTQNKIVVGVFISREGLPDKNKKLETRDAFLPGWRSTDSANIARICPIELEAYLTVRGRAQKIDLVSGKRRTSSLLTSFRCVNMPRVIPHFPSSSASPTPTIVLQKALLAEGILMPRRSNDRF